MGFMNHEAGRDCLLELDDILTKLRLPYFLMQGTALGAYRDGGFTPTERDIDLGVLYERMVGPGKTCYNLFPALVDSLLEAGFDVEQFVMPFTRPRTMVAFKEFRGHVVKADIVGMIPWKGQRFTAPPVRDYEERPYCLVHEAHLVESYRESRVLWGRHFSLPERIDQYLSCEYGIDWRTPKDDHVSRTRMYNYIELEGIPKDYLEQWW